MFISDLPFVFPRFWPFCNWNYFRHRPSPA